MSHDRLAEDGAGSKDRPSSTGSIAARRFNAATVRAVSRCLIVYTLLSPPYNPPYNNKTESDHKTKENFPESHRTWSIAARRFNAATVRGLVAWLHGCMGG